MYPDPNQNQPSSPRPQPPAFQPMQTPAQPQPATPQYSIDYLNQIAPQPKKAGLNNKTFFLLIGGGLLFAIIVGVLAFSSGSGPKQQMETLAARMQTLQTISQNAQKNIKSGTLRSTNSNLSIFLTNANHDIADPLKKNGIDIKKLDKKIVAAEKDDALTAKLEDARLNAVYDQTYAREMGYQLATVKALMKTIYNKSKSKSMKDFLSKTNDNLAPITKQLDDFNPTTAND